MTTLLLLTALAAPVSHTFEVLPPGSETVLDTGEKVRYYGLAEFLELVAADAELKKLRLDVGDLQLVLEKRELTILHKDHVIKLLEEDKGILRTRGLRLEGKWHKCEEDLVAAVGGPVWPYAVAIAGALVGVVGATAYLVERAK